MARTTTTAPKAPKEPGRLKQMYQVFQMTRRYDKLAIWYLLLAFLLPVLAGIILAIVLGGDSILAVVLYVIAGVLGGVLLFLIVLGRRAEKAAYSQIEGQPGAVGAVLKSSLRRGWTASEMPVSVSPKTPDAVYRAVGRGGVALINTSEFQQYKNRLISITNARSTGGRLGGASEADSKRPTLKRRQPGAPGENGEAGTGTSTEAETKERPTLRKQGEKPPGN